MEPSFKDVLFLKEDCFHDHTSMSKYMKDHKSLDEIQGKLIAEELCGKYYPGFLKYFKHNYENCLNKATKNSQKSIESRIKGNELFTKGGHTVKSHEEMWKYYSESIAFAPIGSEELALAYGNRSSLLLHFKKYNDCIDDIDRAVAITEFDLLKVKLLCRKMTCLVAINGSQIEKQSVWEVIDACFQKVEKTPDDNRLMQVVEKANNDLSSCCEKKLIDVMYKSRMPIVSDPKVKIVRHKKHGTHIKAAHDFAPGEVIFVTKPYVTSVNPNKFYAYCSHCLSFMWAGIPCDNCSLCMYCSTKCKNEAWEKYHDIECKINPHINFNHTISYHFQISIRAFLMGLKESGNIVKFKDKVKEFGKLGSSKKEIQNANTFLDFHNMMYIDLTTACHVVQITRNVCLLLAYMTQTCDIFGKDLKSSKGKSLAKNDDVMFVGNLLMRLLMSSTFNGRHVHGDHGGIVHCSKKHKYIGECELNRCCSRGLSIEPSAQLFAHNCNPNAAVCYTDDNGKMIYYCMNSIKTDQQIYLSKFGPFFNISKDDRVIDMKEGQHSLCECKPCRENWPALTPPFEIRIALDTRRKQQAMKIFDKHENLVEKIFFDKDYYLDEKELQVLAIDTDIVLKAFGQPSFASMFMLISFCGAFEKLYGICPFESQIPSNCQLRYVIDNLH